MMNILATYKAGRHCASPDVVFIAVARIIAVSWPLLEKRLDDFTMGWTTNKGVRKVEPPEGLLYSIDHPTRGSQEV
jgi:hypothetical protein